MPSHGALPASDVTRALAGVLVLLVVLGALGPPASAQAPGPKVTITGLVDNVTSWTSNLSTVDLNYARTGDTEWYARTRVRPDITAEVGTTKFVLSLEIDATWGQTGATDTTAPNRNGTTSSLDLNTDTLGNIELRWAYTEFDVPLVPWASRLRLGAQPFATTYKPSTLATGDFAGAHLTTTLTPAMKLNVTWAQVEEESTGPPDGFVRGEDYALIASVEATPLTGLSLRPIYALFVADGVTSGAARQARGGLGTSTTNYPGGNAEWRHTIGLDARWRSGGLALEPTVFYQWGEREVTPSAPFAGSGKAAQERSAWFIDFRGGWTAGPLLVEAAVIYTTGNRASEDIRSPRQTVRYYEPIDTDQGFFTTWAEIWAKGIEDTINIMYATASGLNPGQAIGYDKYGLVRLGARLSYALTSALTLRGALSANWTAEEVDSSSTLAAATGLTPGDFRGDSSYLGTELDLGFQWRWAPGLALDVVGAYMWAGNALSQTAVTSGTGAVSNGRDPQDVMTVVWRVRYTF
ncbi:MAG: hypothetical protein HY727_15025 [Candidatus Rokubacteria bacterium]|nr:hypothetical protein [Candidatus Rokubacteria bacterium]